MRACGLLVCAAALLLAAPADAARRRRQAKPHNEPLDIVVLPFASLAGQKATQAKEALELELELIDNTRVVDAEQLLADIDDAGAAAFTAPVLSRLLKKRGIEVLVGAPSALTSSTGKPLVVAWGADGLPHAFREVAAGAAVDQIAATTLSFLKPALAKWPKLPVAKLPTPVAAGVDDDDVLAPADRPVHSPRPTDDDVLAPADRSVRTPLPARAVDDDDDDRAAPKPRPTRAAADAEKRRPARSIDDDDDDARPKAPPRPVARDDDDAAPARRRAPLDERDLSGLDGDRRSLLGAEDDVGGGGTVKDAHLIALSGTFDGATWYYKFDGDDGVQPDAVQAGFYPGGSARVDLWPFPWLGLDAGVSLAAVQFQINSNANLTITPNRFVSWHVDGGAAIKARLLLHFADDGVFRLVGIGARAGYRHWGASVEKQIVSGSNETLTVVPGFQLNAFAVGPEVYLPLFIGDRRVELELKVDALPATDYREQPDNPGGSSLAFGYHAELLLRVDLFSGFFVEAAGKSTGLTVAFDGAGDRATVVGGSDELVPLQGGRSINVAAGASVGVGFMF